MAAVLEPGAARRPGPARARRRRRVRIAPRAVVLIVVSSLIVAAAVAPARKLLDQRAQMAALQRRAATLEGENAVLQARVNRLNDPVYLKELARECLGMVEPGEIAFVIVPKHGAPAPPAC